jgi:cytochrome P450 family 619
LRAAISRDSHILSSPDNTTGPPTIPILGNLHQIPTKGSYLTFTKWSKQYNPDKGIISLKLGPATGIVLTSRHYVKQLLDKKSNIYSDRPHSYVSHNLITGGDHVLISHYGKTWQKYRKTIHQHFMESIVMRDHLPLQQAEASQLLFDFLEQPELHMDHPKRYTNSIACATIWGVRSPTVNTPHMKRLYELMENWSVVMEPGK